MIDAEAAYFEANHCQHVAAYYEHLRIKRNRKQAARDWAKLDGRNARQHARDYLASLSPERRAELHKEWL